MDPIAILYQDELLVAVSKPGGLLVHRTAEAAGERRFLLQIVRDQLGGDWLYPVHRVDRAASGIVLLARDPDSAAAFQAALADPATVKRYWALVVGSPPDTWVVDRLLTHKQTGRKQTSLTEFECCARLGMGADHVLSLVQARPHTGRRHQIRRHLAGMRHFILGDTRYGKGRTNQFYRDHFGLPRLCLHAQHLRIRHPGSGQDLVLQAPLADDLQSFLERIQSVATIATALPVLP